MASKSVHMSFLQFVILFLKNVDAIEIARDFDVIL